MPGNDAGLPALIDRARTQLDAAITSAQVFEARAVLQAALHYARQVDASHETIGAVLLMLKRSEIRMADEIDAAQKRGEVAKVGERANARTAGISAATFDELGISSQRVAEWRKLRDAGEEVVAGAIQSAIAEGRAPTQGQAFFYFGHAIERFRSTLGSAGLAFGILQ